MSTGSPLGVLGTLPLEVRTEIYDYVFSATYWFRFEKQRTRQSSGLPESYDAVTDGKPLQSIEPRLSILQTSKAIHAEAEPAWHSTGVFEIRTKVTVLYIYYSASAYDEPTTLSFTAQLPSGLRYWNVIINHAFLSRLVLFHHLSIVLDQHCLQGLTDAERFETVREALHGNCHPTSLVHCLPHYLQLVTRGRKITVNIQLSRWKTVSRWANEPDLRTMNGTTLGLICRSITHFEKIMFNVQFPTVTNDAGQPSMQAYMGPNFDEANVNMNFVRALEETLNHILGPQIRGEDVDLSGESFPTLGYRPKKYWANKKRLEAHHNENGRVQEDEIWSSSPHSHDRQARNLSTVKESGCTKNLNKQDAVESASGT